MSETKTYYYARVSTNEQSLDRQLETFRQLGAEEKYIFTDKQSRKNLERTTFYKFVNKYEQENKWNISVK